MESILKLTRQAIFRKAEDTDRTKCDEVIAQLRDTQKRMESLESKFDFTDDGAMLDAVVFELDAEHKRYEFLLSEARRLGAVCPDSLLSLLK